jgi:hypothetical protein
VNVCARAVTHSNFPNTVEGFSRLLGQPSRERAFPPLQEPTAAKALAGALLGLSKVTNGSSRSVTFEGGIDCAWLAAVVQWLLALRVEIVDIFGECLYSNTNPNSDLYPQVTIIRNSPDIVKGLEAKVLSRSYSLPAGRLCFILQSETTLTDSSPHFFSQGRTEWASILHSAFGSAVDELLRPEHADRLVAFLCSRFSTLCTEEQECLTPWGSLSLSSGHQIKRAFLSFAANRLPELKYLLPSAPPDCNEARVSCSCFPTLAANTCPWVKCHPGKGIETICLRRVGLTIFGFLWILCW